MIHERISHTLDAWRGRRIFGARLRGGALRGLGRHDRGGKGGEGRGLRAFAGLMSGAVGPIETFQTVKASSDRRIVEIAGWGWKPAGW